MVEQDHAGENVLKSLLMRKRNKLDLAEETTGNTVFYSLLLIKVPKITQHQTFSAHGACFKKKKKKETDKQVC